MTGRPEEAEVRKLRVEMLLTAERTADKVLCEILGDGAALCDSWLARGRVIEEQAQLIKTYRAGAALAYRQGRVIEAARRAVYIAEHLHQMVPREVWREHGAEWMGQYEGDYHAEQVRDELVALAETVAACAADPKEQT